MLRVGLSWWLRHKTSAVDPTPDYTKVAVHHLPRCPTTVQAEPNVCVPRPPCTGARALPLVRPSLLPFPWFFSSTVLCPVDNNGALSHGDSSRVPCPGDRTMVLCPVDNNTVLCPSGSGRVLCPSDNNRVLCRSDSSKVLCPGYRVLCRSYSAPSGLPP